MLHQPIMGFPETNNNNNNNKENFSKEIQVIKNTQMKLWN